ncbi:MAG TPA: LysR family transcriptional regulator [Gammaproteobacteria bacterium]
MTQKGNHPETLEWDLIRAFLAVVDTGSVTAAAEILGSSQPTLSRQIAALEQRVGSPLFERVGRGLNLTGLGEALVEPARQMQMAANSLSLAALGRNSETAGTVRLSASEMTATYVLPSILAELRRTHPEIQIEVAVTNRVENLLEREADIAVRHTQPGQGSLIARRIGAFRIGAFAHHDYLSRVGEPIEFAQPHRYDWLGLDRSDLLLRGFQRVGMKVDREFFAIRCDDQVALWQMVLSGMGIGFGTLFIAGQAPHLRQVLTEIEIPAMPVWVTAHRELKGSARIRTVFDALVQGLARVVDAR